MSASHPFGSVVTMSNTETIQQARYEIDTLIERITANEAIWGPGCRPELRARLRDARLRLGSARLAERQAEAQRERNGLLRMLEWREVLPIKVAYEGKLHADDDFGQPECGADGDGSFWESQPLHRMNGRRFVEDPRCCKRCAKSLWAWARED